MFPLRYFPSRYFPTGYWTKEYDETGDGGVYPTPSIWIISSRERQWTIDYIDSQTDNIDMLYSWNLPTRTKEWSL